MCYVHQEKEMERAMKTPQTSPVAEGAAPARERNPRRVNTEPVKESSTKEPTLPLVSFSLGRDGDGNDKLFHLGYYKDELYAHVRIWDERGPTKKGASFTMARWVAFTRECMDILQAIHDIKQGDRQAKFSTHVGGGLHVKVNPRYKCVDLRHYFCAEEDGQMYPTKRGIILTFDQFAKLEAAHEQILLAHPEVEDIQPCYMSHDNQMAYVECKECNPTWKHDTKLDRTP